MAFGMSAASAALVGSVAAPLVGGLLGSQGSSSSSTSKIDDRLAPYVYGKDGKGGLLGDVMGQYQQQFAQGGLNPMMRAGLESQRQVLMSPQYTQGYDAMRSMGLGLMGGGVAQNPFTSGGGMGGSAGGAANPQMQSIYSAIGAMAPSLTGGAVGSGGVGVVRPSTAGAYQPVMNAAIAGAQTPFQSVAEYQAANPKEAAPDAETVDDLVDKYMRENKLGKYATSNGENFA